MPTDYRTAVRVADDVVHHAPVSRRTLAWLCIGAVVGVLACFFMALDMAAAVDVACSHEEGACTVTTTRLLLGESKKVIALGSIAIVKVDSFRAKKSSPLTYAVVFVSPEGKELQIPGQRSTDRVAREALRDRLVAFCNDPHAPRLVFPYAVGQRFSLYLIPVLVVFVLIVLFQLMERTRVAFRWDDESVQIVRRRWPLRSWSRTVRMAEIARAHVIEKDHTFNAALELVSGENVPLLSRPFYFRKNHQATADSLQALVARARASVAALGVP